MEISKFDTILNTINAYLEDEGLCAYAYDGAKTCMRDDCTYCAMVRAYINLQNERRSVEVQQM